MIIKLKCIDLIRVSAAHLKSKRDAFAYYTQGYYSKIKIKIFGTWNKMLTEIKIKEYILYIKNIFFNAFLIFFSLTWCTKITKT